MWNETIIEEQAKGFHWHTAIFVGLLHLGAVAALFMFNWRTLVVAIALWCGQLQSIEEPSHPSAAPDSNGGLR